jgi:hypothetical protein
MSRALVTEFCDILLSFYIRRAVSFFDEIEDRRGTLQSTKALPG